MYLCRKIRKEERLFAGNQCGFGFQENDRPFLNGIVEFLCMFCIITAYANYLHSLLSAEILWGQFVEVLFLLEEIGYDNAVVVHSFGRV